MSERYTKSDDQYVRARRGLPEPSPADDDYSERYIGGGIGGSHDEYVHVIALSPSRPVDGIVVELRGRYGAPLTSPKRVEWRRDAPANREWGQWMRMEPNPPDYVEGEGTCSITIRTEHLSRYEMEAVHVMHGPPR